MRKKWEYLRNSYDTWTDLDGNEFDDDLYNSIKDAGLDGWELVQVVVTFDYKIMRKRASVNDDGDDGVYVAQIFKREVE